MRAGMGAELCQAADDVLVVSRTKRGRKRPVAWPDLLGMIIFHSERISV